MISEPGSRVPSTIPLVVAIRFWAKELWLNAVFMVASVVLAIVSEVTVTVAKTVGGTARLGPPLAENGASGLC